MASCAQGVRWTKSGEAWTPCATILPEQASSIGGNLRNKSCVCGCRCCLPEMSLSLRSWKWLIKKSQGCPRTTSPRSSSVGWIDNTPSGMLQGAGMAGSCFMERIKVSGESRRCEMRSCHGHVRGREWMQELHLECYVHDVVWTPICDKPAFEDAHEVSQ